MKEKLSKAAALKQYEKFMVIWLEKNNQDEIISRRPTAQRMMFGLYAGLLLWLAFQILPSLLPLFSDPATCGAGASVLFLFVFPISCFLLGTSSRQLCLDIRGQQYSLTQGVWFLTWTKRGETKDGEVYIARTKSGYSQVRFRARRWKYGMPLESCKTEAQAHSLAWEIAGKMGLGVRTSARLRAMD